MPVLLFDVDDTLVDRAGAFARLLDAWAREHPEVGTPEARARIHALDDRGAYDRAAFAAAVTASFPALGPAPAFQDRFLGALIARIRPHPGVIELLAALRQRHRIAAVTNGPRRTQTAKLEAAGLAVETIFEPADVGVEKPHPLIFQRALDWARCAPADCLFVGDDPERDVAGAAAVGIPTAWIAGGRDYPPGLPRPTHVLPDLLALRAVVPC